MSAVPFVTTANFVSEVMESSVPVLVDFYADWCGPCRMLAPVLEKMTQEYSGRVKIVKVNIDKEPRLASYFRVQSIPTLLAFHEGKLVETVVGVGSPGQLRLLLTKLAASANQPVAK